MPEQIVCSHDFKDGGYVRIVASMGLDTEKALEAVEELVALKRDELARKSENASPQAIDHSVDTKE